MELKIDQLFEKIQYLAPAYSEKFHISLDGSKLFLRLAIIETVKQVPKLDLRKIIDGVVSGNEEDVQKVVEEVESWDEDEFELEDFEVIGYCKNIR